MFTKALVVIGDRHSRQNKLLCDKSLQVLNYLFTIWIVGSASLGQKGGSQRIVSFTSRSHRDFKGEAHQF